jgi:hypothetical protein
MAISTLTGTTVLSSAAPLTMSATNSSDVINGGLSRTGANQGVFNLQLANGTAATSGQNYASPLHSLQGQYWNGSASTASNVSQQLAFGSGSNPAETYLFVMGGTPSSGVKTYAFDQPVNLPTGSFAVTQTTGDNSTKIATDAFVTSAIASCTPSAHGVFNGISYTSCYTGSTFDVRVNAAMSDAESLANGNTTGIVDSTTEPQSVTQTAQITAGDGTHRGLWRIGAGLFSSVSLTGGTGYAVLQNPQWAIQCVGTQNTGCEFSNASATNGMYALYGTNGTGYYYLDGVYFANRGGGGTMASGHLCIINAGYDGSIWNNMQCQDTPSANPSNGSIVTVTGANSHSNFTNDTFDSEWGSTALELDASSSSSFGGINFHNTTANVHGSTATGNPNILCHDTGPGLYSKAIFTGSLHMEGQAASSQTAAWIQDNGCQALDFSGALIEAFSRSTSTTSQIIDVSSAFETTLKVGTVTANGSGWTYPATIVKQHNTTSDCGSPPCNVAVTDSAGNSPGYVARTMQFNNLNVGGAITLSNTVNNAAVTFATGSGGDSTCPAPASGLSFLCSKSSGIAASINGGGYAALPGTQVYTVSTLPSGSSVPAGTMLVVSDAASFTPGSCTGGGSDYMIAITNGSSWSCH